MLPPLEDWFRGLGMSHWGQQQGPVRWAFRVLLLVYVSSEQSWEIHWTLPPVPSHCPASRHVYTPGDVVYPTEVWLLCTTFLPHMLSLWLHMATPCVFLLLFYTGGNWSSEMEMWVAELWDITSKTTWTWFQAPEPEGNSYSTVLWSCLWAPATPSTGEFLGYDVD